MRVLIVDDSDEMRSCVVTVFNSSGHDVVACSDPREALQVLEQQGYDFDLIFTDMMMPYMTGEKMLQQLHATGKWRGPSVIFTSAPWEVKNLNAKTKLLEKNTLGNTMLRVATEWAAEAKRWLDAP